MRHHSLPDTDAMFDTSPAAMAARFGRRTMQLIRDGRDPFEVARLAASYAFLTEPDLRGEPVERRFGEFLFRLGCELNRAMAATLSEVRH